MIIILLLFLVFSIYMLRKKLKEQREEKKTSPFVGHSANISFDIKLSDSILDVFDTDVNFTTMGDTFKEINLQNNVINKRYYNKKLPCIITFGIKYRPKPYQSDRHYFNDNGIYKVKLKYDMEINSEVPNIISQKTVESEDITIMVDKLEDWAEEESKIIYSLLVQRNGSVTLIRR